MRAVKPVQPIRAARAIGWIMLRPAASMGPLRLWLWFARRKTKERATAPSASTPASVDALEIHEDRQREDVPSDEIHIVKRA